MLRLKQTPGVVNCKILNREERDLVLQLEGSSAPENELLGMRITNEGVADVLARSHVVLIAHSKTLRHPPGPIVVIRDNGNIIGEEIWQSDQLMKLSIDSNAILLGKSLVLYRDGLAKARGKRSACAAAREFARRIWHGNSATPRKHGAAEERHLK